MASGSTFTTAMDSNGMSPPPPAERHQPGDLEKSQTNPPAQDATDESFSRDIHGWKWGIATFTLLSSIFLYSLDSTIVAVIQPSIVNEFDSLSDLSWINVGFLFGGTAFNMVWGQIYSQFNSKWIYIFNVVLFELGSAICGAAPTMNALIVGRVMCGVGGSGLYNGAFTLISQTTTMAERPLYVSGTGFTWGLGTVLGPLVGGAFDQSSAGWRWAFYINLFIGAACAPAWLFLLPSKDPRPGVKRVARLKQLDYIGMVLLMGCLISLIMAINFGGLKYAWDSGQIIGLFVTSVVLFVLLSIQQGWSMFTTLTRRLIPVELIRSPIIVTLFVCTAAAGAGAFVTIYFVPLFFQFTRGNGALETGVRLLPLIICLIFAIGLNGALMAKFGYYMPWYLFGGVICVVGGALMYKVDRDTSSGHIYGYTVIIGIGVGMWLQASFSVAQAKVEQAIIPSAIGFITLAQFLGNTTALAIANAIFLNMAEEKVRSLVPNLSAKQIEEAISGVNDGIIQDLEASLRDRVVGGIVDAISTTYILVITAGALTALLSLTMKRERLFVKAAAASV